MMQVISTEAITDSGVSFTQDASQFKCTKDGPEVNTQYFEIGKWKFLI